MTGLPLHFDSGDHRPGNYVDYLDYRDRLATNPHCDGECADRDEWCPYCLPHIRRVPVVRTVSPSGERSRRVEWWCCQDCGAERVVICHGSGDVDGEGLTVWARYHGACTPWKRGER